MKSEVCPYLPGFTGLRITWWRTGIVTVVDDQRYHWMKGLLLYHIQNILK